MEYLTFLKAEYVISRQSLNNVFSTEQKIRGMISGLTHPVDWGSSVYSGYSGDSFSKGLCIGDSTETDSGTGVDELHRYLTGGFEETQETSARIAKIIEESN